MELNREQIVKALECCSSKIGCKECPLQPKESLSICVTQISKCALSLIKELTEKVENYRNELGEVRVALAEANNDKRKLTEENERLKEKADRNLENLKAVLEERNENTIDGGVSR